MIRAVCPCSSEPMSGSPARRILDVLSAQRMEGNRLSGSLNAEEIKVGGSQMSSQGHTSFLEHSHVENKSVFPKGKKRAWGFLVVVVLVVVFAPRN